MTSESHSANDINDYCDFKLLTKSFLNILTNSNWLQSLKTVKTLKISKTSMIFSIWILKEMKLNLNNKDIKSKILFQVEKDSCFEVVFMYSDIEAYW